MSFWMRFERLRGHLETMGIEHPGRLVYLKAYHALGLNSEEKSMITAAVEMPGGHNVLELKRLTIKILDVREGKYEEETFTTAEDSTNNDAEDTMGDDEEGVNILQKPMAGKAKSKPGNSERSGQYTKNLYGMNGSAKDGTTASANESALRNRCKQLGHWWRDWPLPLDRNIVSPKMKSDGKAGKGKSSRQPVGGKSGKKDGERQLYVMDE